MVAAELVLVGLLIGGGLLVLSWIAGRGRSESQAPPDTQGGVLTPCDDCQHPNLTHARYCARCGRALK